MIQLQGLTQQFSNGRGIFDLTFEVGKGEVFGFLGPNGAGKSTTIRHLMGYMKPQKGIALIQGFNTWEQQEKAREKIGYLPGEISFMDGMNGIEFIDLMAGMQGLKDKKRRNELIERLQFEPKTPIRKMSKGMKQKIGIVVTFMHNPEVYILDEPTSGLDPLMQRVFIDLVLEEKAKGKTFLISSHSFSEIERTCERAAIIKDGRIVTVKNIHDLQFMQRKIYDITLANKHDVEKIQASNLIIENTNDNVVRIIIQGDYNELIEELSKYNVKNISSVSQSLEDVFMNYYDTRRSL
ncbi:ABC transporter ATP-binding protein (plasmid) [Niallia taxi]|uniref:ABC transporter ATP-binding protein n=1 Tax=Niallia taxi TaxID=2499688 RepID=A0A437K2V6_9BACI|nr:ABC transporter ATP-binding protein [Niallia taxi]MDK8643807.1 ABC transporter ATP-binding protein [Niallia taxi]MED4057695.1 ABC transporter ATP-binding protein [Niallia taxi]RVT56260.1 ABC transporter ATP-binding protein [Niallia taxi]